MHSLLIVLALFASKPKMNEAMEAYRAGRFAKAIELFNQVLVDGSDGGPSEREAREKLVLSLYATKKTDAALVEYRVLMGRFPDFRFDPDRVSPETVKFFADALPKKKAEPEKQIVVVAPASDPVAAQPRVVVQPQPQPEKRWHWYYLTPLGIGQFLAGSPVRGTIIAVLQVGLITLNAVAYALLMKELRPDGTVESVARAYPLQAMSNVAFFGWIGALALGTIDGAFLEP